MTRKKDKNVLELTEGEGLRKNGNVMGVDVGKDNHAICILSGDQILLWYEFSNNKAGIKKILDAVKKHQVQSVAMEATSIYHLKLMFALVDNNIPHLVANPQQTKQTQGKKTDKIDARRIAIAHRDGRLLPSVLPSKAIMELRRCTRRLSKLTQEATKNKQRIHQMLHIYDFPSKHLIQDLLSTKWGLKLLGELMLNLVSPSGNKKISELLKQYCPTSKKKLKDHHYRKMLFGALTDLLNQLKAAPLDAMVLHTEIAQLNLLSISIEQFRQVYLIVLRENPKLQEQFKLLLSVPGIGPDTAIKLLAEIVNIKYFKNASKLAKWSGLAPRVNQSGARKHYTGKIHKGGNRYVRAAMTMAVANIHVTQSEDHPIYNLVQRNYRGPGTKTYWKAICAGARKLLCIIWMLLIKNVRWQPKSITDPQVLKGLKRSIELKIKKHQNSIGRLDQALNRVSSLVSNQLAWQGQLEKSGLNSKEMIGILLKAV